jgi:putative ABC transport system ATP-binding protein
MKLEIRNLTKSFPRGQEKLPVLQGIDLIAAPGEFISVLGPSGCG